MSMIFLVGMPGVGKTYWGKLLAEKYGYIFIDLDDEIEKAEGRTISDIFELDGEEYFRVKESGYMEALIRGSEGDIIIACGGGTPAYHGNMELMKQHGCVVYLEADIGTLAARLNTDNIVRPMFLGADDVEGRLNKLYTVRKPFYGQAHYTLQADETIIANFEKIIALCTDRH